MPESQKFSWINHDAVNSYLNQNVKKGNEIQFFHVDTLWQICKFSDFFGFCWRIKRTSLGMKHTSFLILDEIFEMHVYWISSKKFVQNVIINRREKDWYIYELKDIGTILIDWLNICNFCSSISKSQGPPKILCFELLNVSLYYMYCVRLM